MRFICILHIQRFQLYGHIMMKQSNYIDYKKASSDKNSYIRKKG